MLLTNVIFTIWLGLLQVAASAGTAAPAPGPVVRIEVDARLSNLERIPVRIHVIEKDLNLPEPGVPSHGIQVVSGNAAASDSSPIIRVRVYDAKTQTSLPVTLIKTGEGRDHADRYVVLAIAIPVPDEERDKAVRDYVARLTQEAKTDNSKAAQISRSKNGQAAIENTMKGLYMQNRVGRFILRAEFSSTRPGHKVVHVEAEPRVFQIEYKGEFFNQAGFKK